MSERRGVIDRKRKEDKRHNYKTLDSILGIAAKNKAKYASKGEGVKRKSK